VAKRFTDTGKWAKSSFSKLSLKLKLVWVYLCDNCDHAGIWDPNLELMSFQIGTKITEADIEALGDRVERRGDKLYLPSFVAFQYGNLNPENRVHKSILEKVQKLSPAITPRKVSLSPLQGAMDMDMDMELDMELEEEKTLTASEKEKAIDEIYKHYPRKLGKDGGYKKLRTQLKTKAEVDQCNAALTNFLAHHKAKGTQAEFIPYFSTFVSSWRDWLDPDAGTSSIETNKRKALSFLDEGVN
jgi:hypothetical protein